MVSASHAVYCIFPRKEIFVAAGFGLIHGMASAGVLSGLHLGLATMILTILSFNLGIEIMQLFVIALSAPWLILLSNNHAYTGLRLTGACFAGIAAFAWIIERICGQPNFISIALDELTGYCRWLILMLAVIALISNVEFKILARS